MSETHTYTHTHTGTSKDSWKIDFKHKLILVQKEF